MERTTRKQLASMVSQLEYAMRERGYNGPRMEIADRGADYPYRYTVITEHGNAYAFGERYYKAGDLWEALRLAQRVIYSLPILVTA